MSDRPNAADVIAAADAVFDARQAVRAAQADMIIANQQRHRLDDVLQIAVDRHREMCERLYQLLDADADDREDVSAGRPITAKPSRWPYP
jgi:hypothetical protein